MIEVTPTSSPAKSNAKSPFQKLPQSPVKAKTVFLSNGVPESPSQKKRKSVEGDKSDSKKRKVVQGDESDSDISVLIDSTPPVTKPHKKVKESSRPTKSTSKSTAKAADTAKSTASSTEDEIKNLKSLVFKCGVRKNWSFFKWQ